MGGIGGGKDGHDLGQSLVASVGIDGWEAEIGIRIEIDLDGGGAEVGDAGAGEASAEIWFKRDEISSFGIGNEEIAVWGDCSVENIGAEVAGVAGDGETDGIESGEIVIEHVVGDLRV